MSEKDTEDLGTPVEASREPVETVAGTLGQEGSTGASRVEMERSGHFGLSFVDGYEDPVLLVPPQTAADEAHETKGYDS